jgi:hypothetical protein
MQLLRSVVDVAGSQVDSVKMCEQLLTFISPLIRDEDDTPQSAGGNENGGDKDDSANNDNNNNNTVDEFTMEQRLVSRLIALIEHPDTDVVFNIYNLARKAFRKGGLKRIRFTLVPLSFGYFRLARKIKQRELAVAKNKKDEKEKPEGEDGDGDDGIPKAPSSNVTPPQFTTKKVYQQVHGIITALAGVDEYQSLSL